MNNEITPLRYRLDPQTVDESYKWIVHGEVLTATSIENRYKPDGVHNRTASQLAENIGVLYDNLVQDHLEHLEQNRRITNIEDVMNLDPDTGLIQQVNTNTSDISELDILSSKNEVDITETIQRTEVLETKIGTRNPDDITELDIYEDLYNIKTIIGSEEDKDINGNPAMGQLSTGILFNTHLALQQGASNLNSIQSLINTTSNTQSELIALRNKVNEQELEIDALQSELLSINGILEQRVQYTVLEANNITIQDEVPLINFLNIRANIVNNKIILPESYYKLSIKIKSADYTSQILSVNTEAVELESNGGYLEYNRYITSLADLELGFAFDSEIIVDYFLIEVIRIGEL